MDSSVLPRHVGIIMDGNGRWAKQRGKERSYGHRVGSDNVDKIVTHAFSRGVKALSLYAFSSENWARPKAEVDELMRLLKVYFKKFIKKVVKNKVRLFVMGDLSVLDGDLQKIIAEGMEKTKDYTDNVLNIAVNYGGREEIAHACNELIKQGKSNVTEDDISANIYTAGCPDPDLIVRTGGDLRTSNFLLWQSAYAEYYFTDVLWPDYSARDVDEAVTAFYSRKRRYGGV